MKKYTGWLIAGTLISYLPSLVFPILTLPQALLAWMVPLLIWKDLGRGIRNQTLGLGAAGLAAHLFSALHGVPFHWRQFFSLNLPLLAMFAAVGFLSLTHADQNREPLPHGRKAVIQTAFGTHLLASVINLSVLFVFGDRLQKDGALQRNQQVILARSFCAAAWWSPFFIATGVALTYAPDMTWHKTLVPGMLMSLTAIGYSVAEVGWIKKAHFSGYPFGYKSLAVPAFLATLVIGLHYFRPQMSVLNIICIIAPAGALIFMPHRPRGEMIRSFISGQLPSMSSQFTLFLAAGIFSTGIKSILQAWPSLLSLENLSFTPELFSLVLGLAILAGIMGVHPVVSISVISPLLLPLDMDHSQLDHSQLGFLFLSIWAISTGSSPLSGVGLALVSRYRASARHILLDNWHYALVMWVCASMANLIFFVS